MMALVLMWFVGLMCGWAWGEIRSDSKTAELLWRKAEAEANEAYMRELERRLLGHGSSPEVVAKKPNQRAEIARIMMCGDWFTLADLVALTGYTATSLATSMRQLRKPRHGGYTLNKRLPQSSEYGRPWEYQLEVGPPAVVDGPKNTDKVEA